MSIFTIYDLTWGLQVEMAPKADTAWVANNLSVETPGTYSKIDYDGSYKGTKQ